VPLPDSWRPAFFATPEVRQDAVLPIYDERQLLRGEWTPEGLWPFDTPRHLAIIVAAIAALVFAIGKASPSNEPCVIDQFAGYDFDPALPWSDAVSAMRSFSTWRRSRAADDRERARESLERVQLGWANARNARDSFPPNFIEWAWMEIAMEDRLEVPRDEDVGVRIDEIHFPVNPGDDIAQVVSLLGPPDETDGSSVLTFREKGIFLGIADQRVSTVTFMAHGRRLGGLRYVLRRCDLSPIDPSVTRKAVIAAFGWPSSIEGGGPSSLPTVLTYSGAVETQFIFEACSPLLICVSRSR